METVNTFALVVYLAKPKAHGTAKCTSINMKLFSRAVSVMVVWPYINCAGGANRNRGYSK